jgi:hypothetical protein
LRSARAVAGKAHVPLGLSLAACQKSLSVGFTTAAALVSLMMGARDERRLLRVRSRWPPNSFSSSMRLLATLQNRRGVALRADLAHYERGATLKTSNLPFDELTQNLGSEHLTGALDDLTAFSRCTRRRPSRRSNDKAGVWLAFLVSTFSPIIQSWPRASQASPRLPAAGREAAWFARVRRRLSEIGPPRLGLRVRDCSG